MKELSLAFYYCQSGPKKQSVKGLQKVCLIMALTFKEMFAKSKPELLTSLMKQQQSNVAMTVFQVKACPSQINHR